VPLTDVARALGLSLEDCRARIASARARLFDARAQRVHPGRDEKVLTSWNALMVKGMARAGRVFGRPEWVASARRAVDFIRRRMWRDGRLLATCRDGRAHLNAYLDDYAFLIDALLELAQTDFRPDDLTFAQTLADVLMTQFEDTEDGGFWFTSHDHEKLIHRPKTGYDGATPSGNGVAAYALQRLGHLAGEPRYLEAARRTIALFYGALEASPSGCTTLLTALEEALEPARIVVLRGPSEVLAQWQTRLAAVFRPDAITVGIESAHEVLPAALDKRSPSDAARVSAWVCQGVTCLPPVFALAELEQVLAR
jgi:uncharacterized protein YyaL (SSP411 family)